MTVWSGSAGSAVTVNLTPPGTSNVSIRDMNGSNQVGDASTSAPHASLWSGTAASWVDLNPAGSLSSYARAFSGSQQGGQAHIGGVWRASLWSGTAASRIDMHPPGATHSDIRAMSGFQQAGIVFYGGTASQASIWSGSAASHVSIHPAGATRSIIHAISGPLQIGEINSAPSSRASLWSGTAASWVNLNPAGAFYSGAVAGVGLVQVGLAALGPNSHASLWNCTPGSFVNLHSFLPPGFSYSAATCIATDGFTTFIGGYAFNTVTNRSEAILWTRPWPAVTGTLQLSDAVSSFAMPRTIGYSVLQGTTVINSGSVNTTSSSSPLSFTIPSGTSGSAQLVLDGSSWLKRRINLTLTGSNQSIGSVLMQNGDADASGEVDAADIDAVIADFGSTYPGGPNPNADVDVSGETDAADIDIIIANFGAVDD